jgi:hypothetical protein
MRVLLVGDANDVRLTRHGRLLVDAGWDVQLADPGLEPASAPLQPRLKIHRSPKLAVHEALRVRHTATEMVTRRATRRLRLAAARTSYRAVDAARTVWHVEIDPGPLALRPPDPALNRPERLGRELVASGLWPEHDVPWLARLIERLRPDVVTSVGFVPHGLLVLAARRHRPSAIAPWLLALAEPDQERIEQDRALADALQAASAAVSGLFVEREQELAFATPFGFGGDRVYQGPFWGGWCLSTCQALRQDGPVSRRRTIAVSGRRGVTGRPFVILRALQLAADALQRYRIEVYAPGEGVEIGARLLAVRSGLEVAELPDERDEDLLRAHGRARCSLTLETAERTDPSLLDAMVMGSLPIGSIACRSDGWIRDAEAGLLVDPEDPPTVAAALRRALTDDALVDHAAVENGIIAATRLSRTGAGEQILALYRRTAGELGRR